MLEWGRVEEHKTAAQGYGRISAILSVSEEQRYSFGYVKEVIYNLNKVATLGDKRLVQ